MSRTPFAPPSGCPPISVDLDILGDLPFCSVPELTEPSFVPRIVVIDPPDIAVPEPCVCMSVNVNAAIRVDDVPAGIAAGWTQTTDDCCDAGYNLNLDVDVPCMPFTIDSELTISVADVSHATGRLWATNDNCELGLNLSLRIPCIPFTFSISGDVSMVSDRDPSLLVSMRHHGCAATMEMHLGIPCLPFSIDDSQTSVQVSVVDISDPFLSIGLRQEGCVLRWGVDLDLPCFPFSTATEAAAISGKVSTKEDEGPGQFELRLGLRQQDCKLSIIGDYTITFPAVANAIEYQGLNSVSVAAQIYEPYPGSKIKFVELVNDQDEPGAGKYYGTDGAGAKGFFPLPSGAIPIEGRDSVLIELSGGEGEDLYNVATLVNDKSDSELAATVGVNNLKEVCKLYGYASGRGWQALAAQGGIDGDNIGGLAWISLYGNDLTTDFENANASNRFVYCRVGTGDGIETSYGWTSSTGDVLRGYDSIVEGEDADENKALHLVDDLDDDSLSALYGQIQSPARGFAFYGFTEAGRGWYNVAFSDGLVAGGGSPNTVKLTEDTIDSETWNASGSKLVLGKLGDGTIGWTEELIQAEGGTLPELPTPPEAPANFEAIDWVGGEPVIDLNSGDQQDAPVRLRACLPLDDLTFYPCKFIAARFDDKGDEDDSLGIVRGLYTDQTDPLKVRLAGVDAKPAATDPTGLQRVYGYSSAGHWGLFQLEALFKFDATNKRFYIDLAGYSGFKSLSTDAATWDFNADANLDGKNGATFDVVTDVAWDSTNNKLVIKKRTVTLFKFGLKSISAASPSDVISGEECEE